MPALTRRRSTDAREECWHVYYGDVRAGTIEIRTGIPYGKDPSQAARRCSGERGRKRLSDPR
jgi:hypothetical protein